DADRARLQGERVRPRTAGLRHPRAERHRLLSALGEDLLPRSRPDDAPRPARLLGRRGLSRPGGFRGKSYALTKKGAGWGSHVYCRGQVRARKPKKGQKWVG